MRKVEIIFTPKKCRSRHCTISPSIFNAFFNSAYRRTYFANLPGAHHELEQTQCNMFITCMPSKSSRCEVPQLLRYFCIAITMSRKSCVYVINKCDNAYSSMLSCSKFLNCICKLSKFHRVSIPSFLCVYLTSNSKEFDQFEIYTNTFGVLLLRFGRSTNFPLSSFFALYRCISKLNLNFVSIAQVIPRPLMFRNNK